MITEITEHYANQMSAEVLNSMQISRSRWADYWSTEPNVNWPIIWSSEPTVKWQITEILKALYIGHRTEYWKPEPRPIHTETLETAKKKKKTKKNWVNNEPSSPLWTRFVIIKCRLPTVQPKSECTLIPCK